MALACCMPKNTGIWGLHGFLARQRGRELGEARPSGQRTVLQLLPALQEEEGHSLKKVSPLSDSEALGCWLAPAGRAECYLCVPCQARDCLKQRPASSLLPSLQL